MQYQFSAVILFDPGSGMHFLHVPEEVRQYFPGKYPMRMVAALENGFRFPCALMSRKDDSFYMLFGPAARKASKALPGDSVSISLAADTSKYGMIMPEEMEAVLETDAEALAIFDDLLPGRQRNLIHHVSKAKGSQTRIDRSLVIAENLKMGIRDPRELIRKK